MTESAPRAPRRQPTIAPSHPWRGNHRAVEAAQRWAVDVITILEAADREESEQRGGYPDPDQMPVVVEWRRIRVDDQLGYVALCDTTEVCATPFTELRRACGSRCCCVTGQLEREIKAAPDGA